MLINSTNISTYGATLIEREFTNHEVVNVNDWLDGAPSPVFLREYSKYKNINLTFLFEGATEQVMIDNIAAMVQKVKFATIKFDDLTYFYDVHLEGTIDMEKITNKAYKVEIELLAHSTYLPEVSSGTFMNFLTKVLNNTGSMDTPVYMTIVPQQNFSTFTIGGLTKKPIELTNLVRGSTYTIDGYTSRFLRDGANNISNFMGYEFPVAVPGDNTMTFSQGNTNIVVKYYPKFN